MRQIPFTGGCVIVTAREREHIQRNLSNAADALTDSSALNVALLRDWSAAMVKGRALADMIVQQNEIVKQIMQVNLLIATALGRVRSGEDIDEVVDGLEAALSEFDPGILPADEPPE